MGKKITLAAAAFCNPPIPGLRLILPRKEKKFSVFPFAFYLKT